MRNTKKQKTEQLELFPKEHGTGLSTDPDNKVFRKNVTRQMSQGGMWANAVADILNKSNMPLQHLVDMQRGGVMIASQAAYGPSRYHFGVNGSPGEQTIQMDSRQFSRHREHEDSFAVVHEAGHALHHVTTKRWMPHEDWLREGYVNDHHNAPVVTQPTKEGIATGYSSKYSGEKDDSYDWLETGVMVDGYRIGPFDPGHYRESQKRVVESGDVPHTSRDVASDNPRTSQARQHKAYMGWLDARSNKRRTTQEERLF